MQKSGDAPTTTHHIAPRLTTTAGRRDCAPECDRAGECEPWVCGCADCHTQNHYTAAPKCNRCLNIEAGAR